MILLNIIIKKILYLSKREIKCHYLSCMHLQIVAVDGGSLSGSSQFCSKSEVASD